MCKYPKKIVPGGSGIPELFFRVSGRVSGILFPAEMASITLNLANLKKKYFSILEDKLNTFLYNFEQCFQKHYVAVISKISKKL